LKRPARQSVEALTRIFYRASSGNRLSRNMGRLSQVRFPPLVMSSLIRTYCAAYKVRMDEVDVPREGFSTFNDFFTRRLKDGARKVDPDPDVLVSPCDGRVIASGTVKRGLAIQAKGMSYPLAELLGDEALCERFEGGPFITIYLSPRDYHRVHFPCDAEVERCVYLPGRLYTVAPRAAGLVDRLLCRNERIDTVMRTRFGTVAAVMVGATGVGRMSVAYCDVVSNRGNLSGVTPFNPALPVRKGDDLGVFNIGSTVVLALEPGEWKPLHPRVGEPVMMGAALLKSVA